MRRLFLRNIVRTGRVFAMNDCGSVLAYTTKGEMQQRHEMCREMKQKLFPYRRQHYLVYAPGCRKNTQQLQRVR